MNKKIINPNDQIESVKQYEYNNNEYVSRIIPLDGLTKREYFAGLAMQGLLNNMNISWEDTGCDIDDNLIAREAVGSADALIAELNKGE